MLKGLLAISGQAGLFKMVSEAKNCVIVESLVTKKRMPAYASSKISSLSDVAVYTETGETPLKEIFKKIFDHEEGKEIPESKSNNELKEYFATVIPEYDHNRVYVSDIKKIIKWYNLLLQKNLLNFDKEEEEKEITEKTKTE
ncbi:MAG: DUF5606 domain-containing protein [Prolixibacteraceae bacterium]|nr:DUF5606 domain-containing protein [Prolixibacteraceae bacterium]